MPMLARDPYPLAGSGGVAQMDRRSVTWISPAGDHFGVERRFRRANTGRPLSVSSVLLSVSNRVRCSFAVVL